MGTNLEVWSKFFGYDKLLILTGDKNQLEAPQTNFPTFSTNPGAWFMNFRNSYSDDFDRSEPDRSSPNLISCILNNYLVGYCCLLFYWEKEKGPRS